MEHAEPADGRSGSSIVLLLLFCQLMYYNRADLHGAAWFDITYRF